MRDDETVDATLLAEAHKMMSLLLVMNAIRNPHGSGEMTMITVLTAVLEHAMSPGLDTVRIVASAIPGACPDEDRLIGLLRRTYELSRECQAAPRATGEPRRGASDHSSRR